MSRNHTARTRAALGHTQPLRSGRISITRLRLHPANMHRDPGDLTELVESIGQFGLLQPLLVQQRGEVHEIVDGRRRYLACRLANLRTVPVMWQASVTDDEVVAITVATDVHKKPMSPAERAHAIRCLRADGWTVREVAERYGKSEATIYNWLAQNPDDAPTPSARTSTGTTDPDPATFKTRRAPGWVQKGVDRLAERVLADAAETGLTGPQVVELVAELRGLTVSGGEAR
ncbi:ParB/RepB/Spo0J family partition protein [Saccharothrix texasensis]|uniref:ParB/RepB/Spo0J family partition protein n=1 Tax=Saccharothrix texasensis TaxID=103734 RepID=A0A3N1H199_9PSEU|nr:ParB/RepB/Spo0J family partition protein [Saccharothrix texasensis]ROP36264.1 ParB/RepB/Spo0J family partition protein [Saccharothrix texasensis]